MTNRWEDVEDLLVTLARSDVEECCREVHPTLVAFSGPHLRFIADVRPFPKGEYQDPLIELFALAAPLDSDRLALSVSGKITSLRDPIPPVLDDGTDLRQRAVVLHVVDGAQGRPRVHTVFHPYDVADDAPASWGEPMRIDEEPVGWIPEAMRLMVVQRRSMRASEARIREQADRCVRLGHQLRLAPDLAERLALAPSPPSRGCRPSTSRRR